MKIKMIKTKIKMIKMIKKKIKMIKMIKMETKMNNKYLNQKQKVGNRLKAQNIKIN